MDIEFITLNCTGSIVLGKYVRGAEVLAYEVRFPGEEGRTKFVRDAGLEKPARVYWEEVARDMETA